MGHSSEELQQQLQTEQIGWQVVMPVVTGVYAQKIVGGKKVENSEEINGKKGLSHLEKAQTYLKNVF